MLEFDGQKLRALRAKRQLTQQELGLIVGKQTADISNYENGYATPPSNTLLNLMSFFKVSAKDLSKATKTEAEV